MTKRPSQGQLALPLLEIVADSRRPLLTKAICDAVAEKVGLDRDARAERITIGRGVYNRWDREVRWAQQRAKLDALMVPVGDGTWKATEKGKTALKAARPGLVISIFTTPSGVALWGSCEDAAAHIGDGEVQLVFSSPPYPLLRQKAYGNETDERAYLDWLVRIAETWPRLLSKTGSVVLNLGDVWRRGEPTISLYQERLLIRLEDDLGLKLCQRFAWHNSAKLPMPAEWVNVRRVRVKNSIENLFWLSNSDDPYADNRNVLVPYSQSMLNALAQGGQRAAVKPAGYEQRDGSFSIDHGGAIPGNLIVAANSESNSPYIRACKREGLPVHPARFPRELPEFFVKMLTREDDLVFDPFSGSGLTGRVAEDLGRRWITSERCLSYIEGARHRFAA